MTMRVARGFDVLRLVESAPLARKPSAAHARRRAEALDLARHEALVDAAYSYCIVALDAPPAELLVAGGEELHAPWLLPASGQLTAIACGACTIGPKLEVRVAALFAERRASLALALDALGNELLIAVSRRAQDRMQAEVTRRGLTMAGELRPGDPGMALSAQAAVLRLAQAETIGIRVNPEHLMHPLKSLTMVLGVGIDLPAVNWSRCDYCPTRDKCVGRDRSAASAAADAQAT